MDSVDTKETAMLEMFVDNFPMIALAVVSIRITVSTTSFRFGMYYQERLRRILAIPAQKQNSTVHLQPRVGFCQTDADIVVSMK